MTTAVDLDDEQADRKEKGCGEIKMKRKQATYHSEHRDKITFVRVVCEASSTVLLHPQHRFHSCSVNIG